MGILGTEHRIRLGRALEPTDGTRKVWLRRDLDRAVQHQTASTELGVPARRVLARVPAEPVAVGTAEDEVHRDVALDGTQACRVAALRRQSDVNSEPLGQAP